MAGGTYLQSLGVAIGPYDAATGRAGDVLFNHRWDKVFHEFGAANPAGKELAFAAHFQIYAAPGAAITAATDGLVREVMWKEQAQAYEIHVQPTENADYFLVYDYVGGSALAVGDVVRAGQAMGTANGTVDNATWAPEIQVVLQEENVSVSPWTFFDPATVEAWRAAVRRLCADWESYKGNAGIYDEAAWYDAGATGPSQVSLRTSSLIRSGGEGADSLTGGNGRDEIDGGAGDDVITGLAWQDDLRGRAGDDVIYGNTGVDWLRGEAGDDTLHGGQGGDALLAGTGSDLLYGNLGADVMFGGEGADTLHGGQGDDTLNGGDGDDRLLGDKGDDQLAGNAGADTFLLAAGGGSDRVVDFDGVAGDRVQLAAGTACTLADGAEGAVLALDDGSTLTLAGVAAGPAAGWIVFG